MQWVVLQGFGVNWKVTDWLTDGEYREEELENGDIKICCRFEQEGDNLTGFAYDSAGYVAIINEGQFVKWLPADELQIS